MKKRRFVIGIMMNLILIILGIIIIITSLRQTFDAEFHWLYILLWIIIIASSVYDLFKNTRKLKNIKKQT